MPNARLLKHTPIKLLHIVIRMYPQNLRNIEMTKRLRIFPRCNTHLLLQLSGNIPVGPLKHHNLPGNYRRNPTLLLLPIKHILSNLLAFEAIEQ